MIESVLFINPDMVKFSLSPSGVSTAMESPIATPIICFTFSVTNASLLACGKTPSSSCPAQISVI